MRKATMAARVSCKPALVRGGQNLLDGRKAKQKRAALRQPVRELQVNPLHPIYIYRDINP